jgi:hypothetical protein
MSGMKARHLICSALLLVGCRHKLTADLIEKSTASIVQKGALGTSTWVVQPDGKVGAVLKDNDDKPITGVVTGQVKLGDQAVPVEYDPKTGLLTASGPKLDADITPMTYALTVDGKPWNGTIAVPREGTQDLADTSKQQASLPAGTVGPNGGIVQVVGPNRVELVANKNDGQVRAYLLDDGNKPIDPGDRKITVALQDPDQPDVVVLAPDPTNHFMVGQMRARVDPLNVTVAVSDHGKTHAAIVGWQPGTVIVTGPDAPRVHLLVNGPAVRVGGPGVVVGAPGVVVDGPPGVVLGGPFGGPPPPFGGPPPPRHWDHDDHGHGGGDHDDRGHGGDHDDHGGGHRH